MSGCSGPITRRWISESLAQKPPRPRGTFLERGQSSQGGHSSLEGLRILQLPSTCRSRSSASSRCLQPSGQSRGSGTFCRSCSECSAWYRRLPIKSPSDSGRGPIQAPFAPSGSDRAWRWIGFRGWPACSRSSWRKLLTAVAVVFGARGANRDPGNYHCAGHQQRTKGGRGQSTPSDAAGQTCACGTNTKVGQPLHRLPSVQVPPQIPRQCVYRFIAPRAILFDRLHYHPVEIAAHRART